MKIFYLDSFLVLNLILDYLILVLTSKLSGVPIKRGFAALAAIVGATFAVGMFFFNGMKLTGFLLSVIAAWLMVSIAFYTISAKKRFQLAGIFLVQTLGFSGLMELLESAGFGRISVKNGVAYIQIEFWQILLSATGAYLLFLLCFRDHSLKLEKHRIWLHAELAGKDINTLLLVDTGNLLREPLSGKSVILLSPEEVAKLLPDSASAVLCSKNWDATNLMAILIEQGITTRLLPIDTASEMQTLTVAVKPDNITLKEKGKMKRTNEYWIGVARKDIDICGGCRGLIGI